MATNFHSDLPNDQIHNPKDFSIASNSSVPVKTNNSQLEWLGSLFNLSTTIICGADVAGVLHNSFFHIFFSKTLSIEVHFSVSGDTTAFVPTAGFTQSSVAINANDTAIRVANAINIELLRLASTGIAAFVPTVDGRGRVTFSGMQNTNDTVDMGTGFVFGNTKTPYGNQSLVSNVGVLSWEEKTDPAVTSLTTTGTSGASTLSSGGVLNIPEYQGGVTSIVAGNNVTISPSGGTGAVTINASGGEPTFQTTTTWRGVIQITEEGRAATMYTFDNPSTGRFEFYMGRGIGFMGASGTIGPVPGQSIVPATRVNITTNDTTNYSWIGRVLANSPSVGGYLRLYKATLTCTAIQPPGYTLYPLAVITIPPLDTGKTYCFDYSAAFTSSLSKGDVIVPVFDGQNGTNNLTYTNTLELIHA